jgi:hypothetical protein
MSEFGEQIIYKQLLERHGRIRIPMIQRDYAQGRPSEAEVREEFLGALESALKLPADDSSLPLNLDFIYGSVEGQEETRFSPLDGQQRLTTLFLLHWYLAWNDGCWEAFYALFRAGDHSRFSYSVRPSSNEFFDALVAFQPGCPPADVTSLSGLITNQSWYFRSWRLDPTIQSTLHMLDALHRRFAGTAGLFARLTSEDKPVITFQLLDLENFGLSDDLYIKMNARGKPLTPFEMFKARYEQELSGQFSGQTRTIGHLSFSVAEFVARRMDTAWADMFWAHRDQKTNLYDEIIMNVFRVVALVTRDPGSKSYLKDVNLLRGGAAPPSYSTFQAQGWLDEAFTKMLVSLLETWCAADGLKQPLLPDTHYFNEIEIFGRLIKDPNSLSASEVVIFSGYALFIQEHEGAIDPQVFQEWMRIVHNLAINSDIDRNERLQSPAKGLRELLPHSTNILQFFSKFGEKDRVSGFADQQVKEETLKAGLILHHVGWRPLIDQAETHGYFRGQIEFLLDFSGAGEQWKSSRSFCWNEENHQELQGRFSGYFTKAQKMFSSSGLSDLGDFRWQRALLSIGDYLLPSKSNWSFLVNAVTEPASWKRLLRGSGSHASEGRPLLKQLWDRLTTERPLKDELDEIIASTVGLEPWIEAFVRTPHAIGYCRRQLIRWNSEKHIYLLSSSQMNGYHAELFSYCAYHEVFRPLSEQGALAPLFISDYYHSVKGTEEQPWFFLTYKHGKQSLPFWIEFSNGEFHLRIGAKELEEHPDVRRYLLEQAGYEVHEHFLGMSGDQMQIRQFALDLAKFLQKYPEESPQ